MTVMWVLLLCACYQLLPAAGDHASERLAELDEPRLQQRTAWARSVLRLDWRAPVAVLVVMPLLQVGVASLTDRSPIPSLIELAAWVLISAALASRLRRGGRQVVAAAKERGIELPPRRSSATARRNALVISGAALVLGAAAVAVGVLAGTSTTIEHALIATLGTASALTFLAAFVAGMTYYGDEKTTPVRLP